MNKLVIDFDVTDQDTCTNQWHFNVKEDLDGPVIESIDIEKSDRGCPGHARTIMALVRNIPLGKLEVDALSQATCGRSLSCGMVLASCLSSIRESVTAKA